MSTIASPRQPPPSSHHHPPASPITSSARSSLSLDRNTAPNRRNRTALRDYYNLPATTTPTDTTSTSTSTRSPSPPASATHSLLAPLDTQGFNAQQYVQTLLRTNGLEDVLRVESALIGEIRGADGERKALVYDNYSKLIKATETIRSMRIKMEGEAEVGGGAGNNDIWGASSGVLGTGKADAAGGEGVNVRAKVGPMVDKIAELAGSVAAVDAEAAKLEEKQDGDELARSKNGRTPPSEQQKAAVRWVLAAPLRLEQSIKKGKREDAEKEWERVRAILDKWEGVGGVADVRRRSEEVMQETKKEES